MFTGSLQSCTQSLLVDANKKSCHKKKPFAIAISMFALTWSMRSTLGQCNLCPPEFDVTTTFSCEISACYPWIPSRPVLPASGTYVSWAGTHERKAEALYQERARSIFHDSFAAATIFGQILLLSSSNLAANIRQPFDPVAEPRSELGIANFSTLICC
jgi:hypothetical protein